MDIPCFLATIDSTSYLFVPFVKALANLFQYFADRCRFIPLTSGQYRFPILTEVNLLDLAAFHQLAQTDILKELKNLATQIHPQLMGQTAVIFLAITVPTTTGCINLLVYGSDDLSHRNFCRRTAQAVAASWSTGTIDQASLA
jgi:hypothetical protein